MVPLTCQTACEAAFACGLEMDMGSQLCPGFEPQDQGTFVPVCVSQCMQQPALIQLVDPNDCPGTINTLEAISQDFANVCQNGV